MARKRPIRTHYFNRHGMIVRIGRASTLRGAVKGAITKVYVMKYRGAQIMVKGKVLIDITLNEKGIDVKYHIVRQRRK